MKVLITNDDGIWAPGLWALAREFKNIAQVLVVAPDKERSAIGTAVTLRHPLRTERVNPAVPEVEAYSVKGTPADCVILALNGLVENRIDMVISGINQGLNLGSDVLISGTVGAALQGYLRGLPALAISSDAKDSLYLDGAAKVAALLARKINSANLPTSISLNVNLPDLPLSKIKGINITRLASESHTNAVGEEHDGKQKYYRLIRQRAEKKTKNKKSDIWAIEQGIVSITPLYIDLPRKPLPSILANLHSDLLQELL